MKPIIYSLYYSWYEEYSVYEFTHHEIKSEKQFKSDCINILHKYTPIYISNGGKSESEDNYKTWIGSSDLIQLISNHLSELGYINIKDTLDEISFGVFGSNILQDREEEICKLLGDELTDLIISHNNEVEQNLNQIG